MKEKKKYKKWTAEDNRLLDRSHVKYVQQWLKTNILKGRPEGKAIQDETTEYSDFNTITTDELNIFLEQLTVKTNTFYIKDTFEKNGRIKRSGGEAERLREDGLTPQQIMDELQILRTIYKRINEALEERIAIEHEDESTIEQRIYNVEQEIDALDRICGDSKRLQKKLEQKKKEHRKLCNKRDVKTTYTKGKFDKSKKEVSDGEEYDKPEEEPKEEDEDKKEETEKDEGEYDLNQDDEEEDEDTDKEEKKEEDEDDDDDDKPRSRKDIYKGWDY